MPLTDQTQPSQPVTLIANPYSVHVARWRKMYDLLGLDYRVVTAEPRQAAPLHAPIQFLAPRWLVRPALLRYLWAGLSARWLLRREPTVHAHCASGSGFVAWLSGRPYIVTTYGTEVFGARERGRLYRWMIARVVRNAALLTATTPRMAQVLHEEFGVPLARIRTFSLGIDTDQFHPVAPATRATLRREEGLPADEPCWVINRRSLPLYRTGEVISGFQRYCDTHPHGRLVVLSGDQDPVYSRQLRELVAASPHSGRVQFVDEFLAPPQVARWLQRADFAISVPRTDQLSTSILEALGCGAVPILADLPAYAPLHACPGIVRASDCTPAGFQDVFTSTAGWESRLLEARRAACVTFVQEHYSERVFLPDVAALYHTIGSAGPEGRRRAA